MDVALDNLPSDPQALRAIVAAQADALAEKDARLRSSEALIEKLKAQLAVLKRARFGASSEKIDRAIEQLELALEEIEASDAEGTYGKEQLIVGRPKAKPTRLPLPEHLPRETVEHAAGIVCPECGSNDLHRDGEEITQVLDYFPASFRVVRHVTPRQVCNDCETVVHGKLPSLPIERGKPGPGLIAHVLTAKYCDHLPLHRQSGIYAREGVEIARSTMADWVGSVASLMAPLVEALRKHVLTGDRLHSDDTPVPVLEPGRGRTKTGRLWTYVRDGRPCGSEVPPVVAYFYSPDRKGKHPQVHLENFRGVLHADGYAGFKDLYRAQGSAGDTPITEAACWAHLWMPPPLQGSSEQRRHDKRLQSSIRPSRGEHPASPAVMVRSADRAQSRVTSSKLDAPNGLLRSRFCRSPSHAHCPSHRISRWKIPTESLVYAV